MATYSIGGRFDHRTGFRKWECEERSGINSDGTRMVLIRTVDNYYYRPTGHDFEYKGPVRDVCGSVASTRHGLIQKFDYLEEKRGGMINLTCS